LKPATRLPSRSRGYLSAVVLLLLLAAIVLALIRYGRPLWVLFHSPDQLQIVMHHLGPWAPIGFILMEFIQVVIPPIPGNFVGMIGGYAFGLGRGLLLALTGIMLGATCSFLLSRSLGREVLSLIIPSDLMERFDAYTARRGPSYIFLLLLVPYPIGDWIYYLAGLTVLPLPVFLLMVIIARIPSNLAEVFIGVQVRRFGSGAAHLTWWQWLIFLGLLLVLALLYFLNRRRIQALTLRLLKFPTEPSP
jgi:uncharacterized membrane protein YdjX (TVP38/TMEM64 family)